MHLWAIGGVERQNSGVRRIALTVLRVDRIVAKVRIFDQVPQHVDTKPVDTFAQPETHHVMYGVPNVSVAPIEVGLGGQEGVIIILTGIFVVSPGAAAEVGEPVVGRSPIWAGIPPNVPVTLITLPAGAAIHKPRVSV